MSEPASLLLFCVNEKGKLLTQHISGPVLLAAVIDLLVWFGGWVGGFVGW